MVWEEEQTNNNALTKPELIGSLDVIFHCLWKQTKKYSFQMLTVTTEYSLVIIWSRKKERKKENTWNTLQTMNSNLAEKQG